jgi:hypothetical protein
LRSDDEWTRSFFCNRTLPIFPPEPFRTAVGRIVRRSIIACEEADEDGRAPSVFARLGASIPRIFGMRVGTR